MNIKKGLDKYFKDMIEGYSKTSQGLPMIPRRKLDNDEIYVGEPNEDGWCKWKPIEKNKIDSFDEIELELNVSIHDDIKEYFNSYWFLKLEGTYKNKDITLEGVVPEQELIKFKNKLIEYKQYHNDELEYIPIGMDEQRGYLIVIENSTEKVKIENHDTGKFRILANSLEELILSLKPTIIDFD